MHNDTVFITDADSVSGQALIARFSKAGANLILNSSASEEAWAGQLAALQAGGSRVLLSRIHLCSSSQLNEMLEQAESELGPVSVMVHNQCASLTSTVEHCSEEQFHEIMQQNAKSAFFCTQAIGRLMEQRGKGRIIYVSSIHSEKPTGSSFLFSVSQGAVKMLAREAALFLGRKGITVNVIELGPIEGAAGIYTSELSGLYDSYSYKIPSTHQGTADDLGELAFFLASGQSGFINGADIRLDGGFLMHYMDYRMKQPAKEEPRL